MAWWERLNELQSIRIAAIRISGEELRGGAVCKADLHNMVKKYKMCSCSSLHMEVQRGIMKTVLQEVAGKMFEWKAKELSGDNRAESFH